MMGNRIEAAALAKATSAKMANVHLLAGWTPDHQISKQEGNAQYLIDWYNAGADGGIDWGEPGDWQQCIDIAGRYIDNPEGFCQLRHIDATGMTTYEHAHEDGA